MQSIIKFMPILKERPWGGRALAGLGMGRMLPPGEKIGESWEISDRPDNESIMINGEFRGKTLSWLLAEHGTNVMGQSWVKGRRFPLLIKILDAAERLSLQVHPPVGVAEKLKGEPKTEMWYFLDAAPGAAVLAGLKKGVTRDDFERHLHSGAIETLIHRIPVKKGDAIFIPSGRVHAIDAGCLILEIQQNSDTTYRVHDWGRVGLDGKPREIHLRESMQSIDFEDFEPTLISSPSNSLEGMATRSEKTEGVSALSLQGTSRKIVENDLFSVQWTSLIHGIEFPYRGPAVLHVLNGRVSFREEGKRSSETGIVAEAGETLLMTGVLHVMKALNGSAEILLTAWP